MQVFPKNILKFIVGMFIVSAIVSPLKADINSQGLICELENGYDYGYYFSNDEVEHYTFIVTDDKILSNINPLGTFTDKSDYIEWNIQFSDRTFWFRINLATLILTMESEEANLNFNHQCEIYELTQWNRKLSELDASLITKEYYSKLSYIIREYIEREYFIRTLEMTTEEIECCNDFLKLNKKYFKDIIEVLKKADKVKYARDIPEFDIKIKDKELIDNLISKL